MQFSLSSTIVKITVTNNVLVTTRRVARNSQWGGCFGGGAAGANGGLGTKPPAAGGCGFGGKPPAAGGRGGLGCEAPSARKFCIFCKNNFI